MDRKLAPSWPVLNEVAPKLAPCWPPVGTCWRRLAPAVPRWLRVAPKMAPSWSMLAHVGPPWLHDGLSPKVLPKLAKASTKALPLRPRFFQMSTKALPRAFQCLIVRSGCSSLFPSILNVVSFGCVFQLGLSWQVFKTIYSNVPLKWFL